MRRVMTGKYDIRLELDPIGAYQSKSPDELIESLGLIPIWFVKESKGDYDTKEMPMLEFLNYVYTYGIYESTGVTVDDNGVYQYHCTYLDEGEEQDPPLNPVLKVVRTNAKGKKETFYQYPYALVAIVQEDGTVYASRMD